MTDQPVAALEAVDIVKRFDGVHALEGARLSVRSGEIHALLGENGAGKSTLIKVLTGIHAPDAGEIRRDGVDVEFASVRAAGRAGVVALYQELSTIPTIDVAENILLGEHTPSRGGFVRWATMRRRAKDLLERLNQRIPVGRLGADLTPVQQTMVSVARALAAEARVLILDEPTASLTDTEIRDLFRVLRSLREEGVAIVYVSHRLEEVFELCDRLTVMRNGKTVLTKEVADSSIDEVISTMVGREAGELFPPRGTATANVALRVEGLHGRRVKDVSFSVHEGEVLGIGGLAGSGRSELLRLLAGAQPHRAGSITIGGTGAATVSRVGRMLEAGIALVPEERRSQGVILGASIQDNIALAKKVVLAKMLARRPRVLLMDEPTRGIDVGTKAEIYRLIRELAATGTAVVAVSSELPELIGMSDRILIMHEGTIAGDVPAEGADDELLLSYAYGRAD